MAQLRKELLDKGYELAKKKDFNFDSNSITPVF